MRVEGKAVIVTGGAGGLGRVYVEHLAAQGARILVADLDGDEAQRLAEKVNDAAGGTVASAWTTDVTEEASALAMADAALRTFGRIDVLVNNAGVYPHVPFEEISYEAWRKVISLNLDSVFLCSRAVLPAMKAQGSGKIINVASNLVWIGLAGMVHYIAAKSGVVGFTRALAREVGEYGISVNALAPGAAAPPVEVLGARSVELLREIVSHQAMKWAERPIDLVGPLLFLASSDSDFMSGQIVTVDGGLTNH